VFCWGKELPFACYNNENPLLLIPSGKTGQGKPCPNLHLDDRRL
jgi:hypothetical protein